MAKRSFSIKKSADKPFYFIMFITPAYKNKFKKTFDSFNKIITFPGV